MIGLEPNWCDVLRTQFVQVAKGQRGRFNILGWKWMEMNSRTIFDYSIFKCLPNPHYTVGQKLKKVQRWKFQNSVKSIFSLKSHKIGGILKFCRASTALKFCKKTNNPKRNFKPLYHIKLCPIVYIELNKDPEAIFNQIMLAMEEWLKKFPNVSSDEAIFNQIMLAMEEWLTQRNKKCGEFFS